MMEIDSHWIYNLDGITTEAKRQLRQNVPKLTFVDVRRYRWPFCQALIKEAYEEGYYLTAEFLLNISTRNDYFAKNSKKKFICNCRQFLLSLMECLMSAEKCAFFVEEKEKSLKILLNAAVHVEKTKPDFIWVSEQLYIILIQLAGHFQNKFEQTEARALYFYGKLLNRKLCNFEDAINNLQKSLELCKGREWTKIPGFDTYLSKYVAEELCGAFLNLARTFEKKNIAESEKLSKQAILALIQGSRDKFLHCKAGLKRSEYLISSAQYEDALKVLHKVYPYTAISGKAQYKAEVLLNQGICYFHLFNYAQSTKKLKEAIRIQGILSFKHIRARILCYLGRVYAKEKLTFVKAQSCLWEAKGIFEEVGDRKNAENAKFLSGIQKAGEIMPHLVNMIKENDPDLRAKMWRWKDYCQPFWTNRTVDDVQDPVELFLDGSLSNIGKHDDENCDEVPQVDTKVEMENIQRSPGTSIFKDEGD